VVVPIQIPTNTKPVLVPTRIDFALKFAASLILSVFDNLPKPGGKNPTAATKNAYRKRAIINDLDIINQFVGRVAGERLVAVPAPSKRTRRSQTERLLADPKDPGVRKLREIRTFILHDLFMEWTGGKRGSRSSVPVASLSRQIADCDLRSLLKFISERTGEDVALVTLRVLENYDPGMRSLIKGWAKTLGQTMNMKPKEAKLFLAQRVTFIAECEGERFRYIYPIEEISDDELADKEDHAPYQLVKHVREEPNQQISGRLSSPLAGEKGKKGRPPTYSWAEDLSFITGGKPQRQPGGRLPSIATCGTNPKNRAAIQ
jgi:hypothetical protein